MKTLMFNNNDQSADFSQAYGMEVINLTELNSILIKDRLLKIKARSCRVLTLYDEDLEITKDLAEAVAILYKNNNIGTLVVQFNEKIKVQEIYPILVMVENIDKLKLLKAKQDNAEVGDLVWK